MTVRAARSVVSINVTEMQGSMFYFLAGLQSRSE